MVKKTEKKGFSLVEMLIVIAVVAILVAIVVPMFSHSTVKARAAANAANLRSIEGKIEVFRLQDPDAFENFAKLGEALDKLENLPLWNFLEFLIGETSLSQNFNTLIAANGSITIPMNPSDVTINEIPKAKPLTAPASHAAEVVIYENTPMTIYFMEDAVVATYQGYTKYDFADIAEDGIYDGDYDPSSQDDEEDGILGHWFHKDETGNCICDYKGCGEEYHPGRKGYGLGNSDFCDNVNPACPYQRDYTKTYCEVHGCDTVIVGGKYCQNHTCPRCGDEKGANDECCSDCECEADWCDSVKIGNSDFCTKHKCKSCEERGVNNGYCADHDCQYSSGNGSCSNAPAAGTTLCNDHTCPVCKQAKPSNVTACSSCDCQYTSGNSSCTSAVVAGTKLCSNHTCPVCKQAKPSNAGACSSCDCQYTEGNSSCNNSVVPGTTLCNNHTCPVCKKAKPSNATACSSCTCTKDGCTLAKDTGSKYCSGHSCKNCKNEKNKNDNYCGSCGCEECKDSLKVSGSNYCSKHKCGSCPNKAVNSGFCTDHDCQSNLLGVACPNAPIAGTSYCTSHTCACGNSKSQLESQCDDCKKAAGGGSGTCVTPDTLVTLADGTKKRIDEVSYDDDLLVWDFNIGEYVSKPAAALIYMGEGNFVQTELIFEDGSTINMLDVHGFFNIDKNQFVFIDEANVAEFVGDRFAKSSGNDFQAVKLVDYHISTVYTGAYSLLSAEHYNVILGDILTATPIPGFDNDAFYRCWPMGENMTYDVETMQDLINKHGLFTYEEMKPLGITYDQYIKTNMAYVKVIIGEGVITMEQAMDIMAMFIPQ